MRTLTRSELENLTFREALALERLTGLPFTYLLAGAPIRCGHCHDQPPAGYTCNHCGRRT